MKEFNAELLQKVYEPELGYYIREKGLVKSFNKYVNYIHKMENKAKITEYLRNLGIKTCVKNPKTDLTFKNLDESEIEFEKSYVKFEIALAAFCGILLKDYDCTVGLTKARHDGGFDIAIRSNNSNETLLIDAKSGSNTSDKHVEWEYFADPHNTWLYKVVKSATSTKWENANESKEEKKVFDVSLDKFVENLTKAVMLDIDSISETLEFEASCYCHMNAIGDYNQENEEGE